MSEEMKDWTRTLKAMGEELLGLGYSIEDAGGIHPNAADETIINAHC